MWPLNQTQEILRSIVPHIFPIIPTLNIIKSAITTIIIHLET